MTLILGSVAQRVAHQVGDRLVVVERGKRLSPHDPLSNKQVVVVAPDALVSIGYAEIKHTRQAIKALEEQGIDRRDAITRLLVETIRRTSEKKPMTVGADCMVVRLWREGNKSIAEVEFQPVMRGDVSIERAGRPISVPAAYSPWFLSPGFISSPSIVKGDGGWDTGDVEFRIRAPESGPGLFFGSQDRVPPPV